MVRARVTVTSGARSFVRTIHSASSYLTSGAPEAHFGLGSVASIDAIDVV